MKSCNKATMKSTGGEVNPRVPHSQLPYPKNLISDIVGKYCDMELSAEQVDKLETNLILYCPDGESVQNASKIIGNTEPVQDAALAGKLIRECELSVRLTNCLLRQSIFTMEELLACTWQHLRTFHGFGNVSEGELREYLAAHGLYLLDL